MSFMIPTTGCRYFQFMGGTGAGWVHNNGRSCEHWEVWAVQAGVVEYKLQSVMVWCIYNRSYDVGKLQDSVI